MCAVQCNHVQWLILIDGNCEMNSSSFGRKMSVRCQRRPNDVHFLFLWIFRVHVSFSGPWFSISLLFIILMKKKTATISVNEQLNANARGGKPIWKCNILFTSPFMCVYLRQLKYLTYVKCNSDYSLFDIRLWSQFGCLLFFSRIVAAVVVCLFHLIPTFRIIARISYIICSFTHYANTADKREKYRNAHMHAHAAPTNDS